MNTGEGTTDDSVATMNEQRQMPPLQAEIQTAQAALKVPLKCTLHWYLTHR